MKQDLNREVCLITGASRGIGRAVAIELGRRGAVVAGTSTSEDGCKVIHNYLTENNIKGTALPLNVTVPESVDQALKQVAGTLGDPTILVNNAGVTRDNLLLRMKDAEWDEVMDTDLKSVFRVSRGCLRGMIKARRGRIVNITSVVGVAGNAGQSNYAAAKAGIIGFTKSLAREVAARNITVNAVAPGFIDTDMTRSLTDEQRRAMLEEIPLGRLGTPEDVAQAVAYLAAPSGSYVTGTTLHVNGGMYMS